MRLSAERWFIFRILAKKVARFLKIRGSCKTLYRFEEAKQKKNIIFPYRHKDRFTVNIAIRQLTQC